MTGFTTAGGRLLCDGVSLEEAAARLGTPLYVYSGEAIRGAYESYDSAFSSVPHRICYALKANGTGAILRLFSELGAGADVVSGMELLAARRAGFPPDRIVFAGAGKTDQELALGLDQGIGEFNVESEEEIKRLSDLAAPRGRTARISLRVNPDVDPQTHPYISTGLRESKFGVEAATGLDMLRRSRSLRGVELVGLHCHIGSQMLDLGPIEAAARQLVALSRGLLADGIPLRSLDLGGGLGVDYTGEGAPDPSSLASRILPILKDLPLTLLLEPGRSLVAPAGVLLTRVLYVKRNGPKAFVIVDAGMNDLLRPALYDAYHGIQPVVSAGRARVTVDVVGPVCESGDFLARGREIESVEPGDLLAVRDVGAYGFVMSSNYNLRPRPAEALVEGGAIRTIRRRETFEDLIRTEV